MQFCFIANGDVLTLPITPASYEWTTGKNIETINISQLGDVYLPGNRSRHSGTIECLLPSQDYPFNQPGTILDPGYYLEPLRYWAAEKIPVRYIVTESDINALVYIESVTEKEQDGTGDVYCTIALREYVDLEAQEVATLNTTRYTGNSGRKSDAAKDITYHRVVSGDTLSMLCRRTYGDGTASYYRSIRSRSAPTASTLRKRISAWRNPCIPIFWKISRTVKKMASKRCCLRSWCRSRRAPSVRSCFSGRRSMFSAGLCSTSTMKSCSCARMTDRPIISSRGW